MKVLQKKTSRRLFKPNPSREERESFSCQLSVSQASATLTEVVPALPGIITGPYVWPQSSIEYSILTLHPRRKLSRDVYLQSQPLFAVEGCNQGRATDYILLFLEV